MLFNIIIETCSSERIYNRYVEIISKGVENIKNVAEDIYESKKLLLNKSHM